MSTRGPRHDSAFRGGGVNGISGRQASQLSADGDNRGVTEQLDVLLSAALQRWVITNRSALATRGVIVTLQGPFDAPGMDPIYILRMDSEHRETEAVLFRGGTVLFDGIDKHTTARIQGSSVEVSSAAGLADALGRFAERA
jgi:hypothetical protein